MDKSIQVHPSTVLMTEEKTGRSYDYDIFVIGGDAGSLALAKESSSLGAKVCVAETEQKWGADLNIVKAFHFAALSGDNMPNQIEAGWVHPEKPSHNWKFIQEHIVDLTKAIRRTHLNEFYKHKIDNFQCSVTFEDSHTVSVSFYISN